MQGMSDRPDSIEFLRPYVRWLRTRLSNVTVEDDVVRFRNFPHRTRRVGLQDVDRFDWDRIRDGQACILVRRDGSATRVWGVDEDHPGATTALNNEIREWRRHSGQADSG